MLLEGGALLESQVAVMKPGALRLCPWGLNDQSGGAGATGSEGARGGPRPWTWLSSIAKKRESFPVGRSFPQDKSLVESSVLFFSQFASIRSWQIKLYLRLFKAKLYASGV